MRKMSDLIENLDIVVRVLIEDGYPSKYADSVAEAMYTLERQEKRIIELESSSTTDDADCYCE